MFEIGEKVVCINTDSTISGTVFGIELGKVYTVKCYRKGLKKPCVRLVEVSNKYDHNGFYVAGWRDIGYYEYRFKKLEKQKTDISIFHKIRIDAEQLIPEQPYV